ncbi:unnamed protein product [Vicia faba]|uniref:Uncharacterized protein n=1 Tax=Vicia faba TaxID=3906 RepID=A0AAV0YIS7_VICFA|nr:unnamed protein product [Vicia faba]
MLSQHDSMSQLAQDMFSHETNNNNIIMLAAIISLLLVILFVPPSTCLRQMLPSSLNSLSIPRAGNLRRINCPVCRSLIVDDDSRDAGVEIVIGSPRSYEISESGSVSVSETSLSLFGFSFKRIISKVFLSSHVNQLDHASQ